MISQSSWPTNTKLSVRSASGLNIEATTGTRDGVLDEFYQDYDKAFVLKNEKEEYDGFAECLALNDGEAYDRLSKRYGGFREYVLTARDPLTGLRIGGANFIALPLQLALPSRTVLSINLNYVFVNPRSRRRGYLKRLVNDLPRLALVLLSSTNPGDMPPQSLTASADGAVSMPGVVTFIEQNDPYRMSREDYETDSKYTGLDQFARIAMWARLGAKIVDFPYIQPPLTSDQQADHNLVYGVLGVRADILDACLLCRHLERFFGISVLKGADPMQEPNAATQLHKLSQMCERREPVPLLQVDDLNALRPPSASRAATSLRSVLRSGDRT